MVKTKLQVIEIGNSKQYRVTIPRAMAEGIGLREDDEVEWTYAQGGLLIKRA